VSFFSPPRTTRSSIESEPALVLGPLRSQEEQWQEQQLQEIQLRRQERERRAAEEEELQQQEGGGAGAREDSPPVQERADELTGPYHYEFSYWARCVQGGPARGLKATSASFQDFPPKPSLQNLLLMFKLLLMLLFLECFYWVILFCCKEVSECLEKHYKCYIIIIIIISCIDPYLLHNDVLKYQSQAT